ncbi:MAG TPA: STN domain-containing protein, partial [Vicinamibacterales bacterium]|nr:STN domain-containing protein [Vicinamibacterales bacterium]
MAVRRKSKTRRTLTALMAVGVIGGTQARPATARTVRPDDSALSQSIALWLDRRFGDPWRPSLSRIIDPATAHPVAEDRGVRRYDIPAGTLEAVLAAYRAASGVTITAATELIQGNSPGVSGMFTAEQALERLLTGTALRFRFTAPFAAIVEVQVA